MTSRVNQLPTRQGLTVWLTGLPGSGKTTLAIRLSQFLRQKTIPSLILDGDALRSGINTDLGFSKEDRNESVRRAGEIALINASAGFVSICCLVSPYAHAREGVRRRHDSATITFFEVHVAADLATCERRDPKGLYARARRGDATMVTGIDDPYERPLNPELVLPSDIWSEDECAELLAASVYRCFNQIQATQLRDS
jgi:adenylyl-sulfate kinase